MARQDPRIEALKNELRPMIKRANQRLLRLEQGGLTSSHGYQAAQDVTGRGKPRFGIGGKSLEELQDIRRKARNFLDYKSSTVTGSKELLKSYAKQMRVPFSDDPERLVEESSKFFRLSNYVQEYIRNTSQERHISSDEVFMGISRAVDAGNVDLDDINFEDFDLNMDQMERIIQEAGGDTQFGDLFDDLANMDEIDYGSNIRIREFDPEDF